jgi:nicotinamidase/pyrazinamidase
MVDTAMAGKITIGGNDVLLAVDVQKDFCPGGALAVPHGDEIVPILNACAARFANVVLTQDWHPPGHVSFASRYPGRRPFETIVLGSDKQMLWPDHCVQASPGADFPPDLAIPHAGLVLRKGRNPLIDSYSAFQENDRRTPTGLSGYLRERGLSRLFIAGLAYDVCVRFSAEDAMAAGFEVVIIEDACRGLDLDGSITKTRDRLSALGCGMIDAVDLG